VKFANSTTETPHEKNMQTITPNWNTI